MDPKLRAVHQSYEGSRYWIYVFNPATARWDVDPHPFNDLNSTIPFDYWVYQQLGETGWQTPEGAEKHELSETPDIRKLA